MKKKISFPPKLADVEKVLGPARGWAGRCFEISSALVSKGFVEGIPVYGHWLGTVEPLSYFGLLKKTGMPFIPHGWVYVRGDRNLILDPTRWAFTGEDPYIHFGPNDGEYDEGGNGFRAAMREPCPAFDPGAPRLYEFTGTILPTEIWNFIEKRLGSHYLTELGDHPPGTVTVGQLFWIANTPYDELGGHAVAIYKAIRHLGEAAAIPVDNYQRAMREEQQRQKEAKRARVRD